ncbi:DUF4276 family protein [Polaromonas sp. YR568]|uniref:DUF4276 family protein n=1 Tax=Polaromonas sp. YR568 TaxID=1855301 RepID=UPI0031382C35
MARIGIVVEGNGEVPAFKQLIPKLTSPNGILGQPLRADLQPKATPAQVAASAKAAIGYFCRRNVDLIVVLIDLEDNPSASTFSKNLQAAFTKLYPHIAVEVVVKNSCVENWLIADVDALRKQPKRFAVTPALVRSVCPDKADSLDAQTLLNKAALKFEYDKGADPQKIMSHQNPLEVAQHSRSFRRFLRVIGNPDYQHQSRSPV